MRTLGDLCWLNTYIGTPYEFGGRSHKGVDCYGLVKLLFSEQYDETLPDWTLDRIDLRGRAETIDEVVTSGDFEELDEPIEGCFVICFRTRCAHHIGLYYGGCVLHAVDGVGVVFEPLHRFKQAYPNLKFGEWHTCP